MKRIVMIAFILLALSLSLEAYADGPKHEKLICHKATTSDHNAHVKQERPHTDIVASKDRGGMKVTFKNHTGYYVNVYVDGTFDGTIAPYSSYTTSRKYEINAYCETAGGHITGLLQEVATKANIFMNSTRIKIHPTIPFYEITYPICYAIAGK